MVDCSLAHPISETCRLWENLVMAVPVEVQVPNPDPTLLGLSALVTLALLGRRR